MKEFLSRVAFVLLVIYLVNCSAVAQDTTKSKLPKLSAINLLGAKEFSGKQSLNYIVSETGNIIVQFESSVYNITQKKFLIKSPPDSIADLSMQGENLLFVTEGWLQTIEFGKQVKLLEVPLKKVKMASAKDSLYISGVDAAGKAAIFIYIKKKGWQQLLNLPEPIDAMCVSKGRVFYSIGPAIFSFKIGEKLRMDVALPGFKKIEFIAIDTKNGLLYFSDGKAVYAIEPSTNRVILVFNDAGGKLQYVNNSLYLLAKNHFALYQIKNISELLTSKNAPVVNLREQ